MSFKEPVKRLTHANLTSKLMEIAWLASGWQQVAAAVTSAAASSCNKLKNNNKPNKLKLDYT